MNRYPRVAAALAVLLAVSASAQTVSVPRVSLTPTLGAGLGAPGAISGPGASPLFPALAPSLSLTPTLSVISAPSIAPLAVAEPIEAAAAPQPLSLTAGPAAASSSERRSASAPAARVATALDFLSSPAASKHGGRDGNSMFDGARAKSPAKAPTPYIINDEGVKINDRAAIYYTEVRRMVELYKGTINLEESLDVMDDAYSDVLAKVSAVQAVAKGRGLSQVNTHLEETLTFVDGVLDDGAKTVAVHTHRVFFHKSKEPKSEIAEGIRRVDGYIKDSEKMFGKGGRAEQQMGKLDEVELVFDARGYQEIKDHIRMRGEEMSAKTNGRVKFKFLDELAPLPKEQTVIRAKLNDLVREFGGEKEGLSKIYEGVIYSRYVGLLLELKTVEHYHKLGYKILQSGRELFDHNGMYISELDVVVESPEGKVSVVEAKSARVGLPPEEVLEDKVEYKLRTYKKFRAELDAMIGKKFDAVVFSMDVAIDPNIDPSEVMPKDARKLELVQFLRSKEALLSKEYGFPVSFLFLQSGPEGGQQRGAPRGDRKHGRR